MVNKDRPSRETLGFGVNASSVPYSSGGNVEESQSPQAGALAGFFDDKPVRKFLAAAVGTAVAAGAAGSVLKRVGTSALGGAARQAQNRPDSLYSKYLKTHRDVQKVLDDYSGAKRAITNYYEPSSDEVVYRGFHMTQQEIKRARRLGAEAPEAFNMRQEFQQRMVKLARRMPYELPAAYVITKGYDKFLGDGQDDRRVNYLNPVDAIGDFANETAKNIAFAFLPFEGVAGGTKQAWRKSMTEAATSNWTGVANANASSTAVDINEMLNFVGQSFSNVFNQTQKRASRNSGAFATAITNTAQKRRGAVGSWQAIAKQSDAIERTKNLEELPTVFHQVTNVFNELKKGRVSIDNPRMGNYGIGSSRFERYVHSMHRLSPTTGASGEITGGGFYDAVYKRRYARYLYSSLREQKVSAKEAKGFIQEASFTGKFDADLPFSRRIRFGNDDRTGIGHIAQRADDYYGVGSFGKRAGTEADRPITALEMAMRQADARMAHSKDALDFDITKTWRNLSKGRLADETLKGLGTRKAAYKDFTADNITQDSYDYLINRSARRLGIKTQGKDTQELKAAISNLKSGPAPKGFTAPTQNTPLLDVQNIDQLRGFLMDAGDIAMPWRGKGENIFGFRAVSIAEARAQGYLDKSPNTNVVDELTKNLYDRGGYAARLAKVGGLYQNRRGDVLDFNPLLNAGRKALNIAGGEVRIPLIQLMPLKLSQRFSNWQASMAEGPIRVTAGLNQNFLGNQNLLGKRGKDQFDALFFFGDSSTKGRVSGLLREKEEFVDFKGKYEAFNPASGNTAASMLSLGQSREARMRPELKEGAGSVRKFWRKVQDKLDFSAEQPHSLLSRVVAMKHNLKEGQEGKSWLAQLMLDKKPDELRRIIDADNNIGAYEISDMFGFMRKHTISHNVRRNAPKGSILDDLFAGVGQRKTLYDMPEEELAALVKQMEGQYTSPSQKQIFRNFLNQYKDESAEVLRQPTRTQQRIGGVTTRADSLRQDIVRLRASQRALERGDFDSFMNEVVGELDNLAAGGYISKRENAEAILSMASIRQTYETKNLSQEVADSYKSALISMSESLHQGNAQGLREAIEIIATRRDKGRLGIFARLTDTGADRAVKVNQFNDSMVFVPTSGSAIARGYDEEGMRGAVKAAGGVLGFNSWGPKNANYFSTGSMVTSNLVTRMNRQLGHFGMRLDESQYSGPLDLMARGMAQKRLLPIYAAGASFMALDKTAGALASGDRDVNGDRIYSPLLTGALADVAVRGQALASGITPGGPGYEERLEQLQEGEVPIRSGRFWLLGNTPFLGGKVDYYRPSWYRLMKSSYKDTDQLHGSPMEKLAFGYDFSPLRPLDPYRFERKTAEDRPYPQSGEYFTGPFGPVTPMLNATLGKLLKPTRNYSQDYMETANSSMVGYGSYGQQPSTVQLAEGGVGGGGGGSNQILNASGSAGGTGGFTAGVSVQVPKAARSLIDFRWNNEMYGLDGGVTSQMVDVAVQDAEGGVAHQGQAGPGLTGRITGRPAVGEVYALGTPIESDVKYQAGEFAYRMQEFAGIYGFGFGALRTNMGLGGMDYESLRPTLASPSDAYGAGRAFWDLNLGGMGDVTTPFEGQYANLELSEVARRFIPRPRERTYNPLLNSMNYKAPWLPGGESIIDFKTGDPYTKIEMGEARLPGAGYERLQGISSDETGKYGRMDRFKILADVGHYTPEFRRAEGELLGSGMSAEEAAEYQEIKERIAERQQEHQFTEYQYDDMEGFPLTGPPAKEAFFAAKGFEKFRHMDTYFHRKFIGQRSAIEDYERSDIYGSAFPEWSSPIESFVDPMFYKAGERNPVAAALGMGMLGHMMGATARAKTFLKAGGAVTGAAVSMFQNTKEAITGERYIPEARKKEIAFEEYADILTYTKAKSNYLQAQRAGNGLAVQQFKRQMKSTMYGADIYGGTAEELSRALPDRKQEHFMQFVQEDDPEKRERILSTSGRLERRLYQAAWGQSVEKRPELEEYFQDRELPNESWEGWNPNADMQNVIIKSLQQEGINASQLGYYPQELQRANIANPSYPVMSNATSGNVEQILNKLLYESNAMGGDVRAVPTYGPGGVSMVSGV